MLKINVLTTYDLCFSVSLLWRNKKRSERLPRHGASFVCQLHHGLLLFLLLFTVILSRKILLISYNIQFNYTYAKYVSCVRIL